MMFVLRGLIPYTHENLLLSFKPHAFFAELEKISNHPRSSLKSAYYRARQSGYISDDVVPKLTAQGKKHIEPFIAQKLSNKAKLLVIFDIPEAQSGKRRQFRRLLQNLDFKQIQLSVWMTEYDHRETLTAAMRELGLQDFVQIYEAEPIE